MPGRHRLEAEAVRRAVQATIESVAPGVDVQSLAGDRPLRGQIDLDSMDWLNFIAGLQDRLAIEIPECDHGRLTSVDSIVDHLASVQGLPVGRPGPAAAAGPSEPPSTQHLVDGRLVTVRPMRAEDKPMEAAFVRHLSAETRYQRFMVTLRELSPGKLDYLTQVDQPRHVALVATVEAEGGQVEVGVVRYIVDPAGTGCEFAVAIDDAWQGTGLAGILMHRLIALARARGLATMEGVVLQTNARMRKLARQLGFEERRDPGDRDTVRVVRPLAGGASGPAADAGQCRPASRD